MKRGGREKDAAPRDAPDGKAAARRADNTESL